MFRNASKWTLWHRTCCKSKIKPDYNTSALQWRRWGLWLWWGCRFLLMCLTEEYKQNQKTQFRKVFLFFCIKLWLLHCIIYPSSALTCCINYFNAVFANMHQKGRCNRFTITQCRSSILCNHDAVTRNAKFVSRGPLKRLHCIVPIMQVLFFTLILPYPQYNYDMNQILASGRQPFAFCWFACQCK